MSNKIYYSKKDKLNQYSNISELLPFYFLERARNLFFL